MTFDLMNPGQLMQALGPDLILMAGAMVAMLVAAWKAESDAHQRTVGYLSLGVIGEYLGRIQRDVENRPLYAVREEL